MFYLDLIEVLGLAAKETNGKEFLEKVISELAEDIRKNFEKDQLDV